MNTRPSRPNKSRSSSIQNSREKNHIWFVRKSYGWGYNPVSKEGWSVVAVHIALLLLWADLFLRGKTESSVAVALFMGLVLAQTGLLIFIAHKTAHE